VPAILPRILEAVLLAVVMAAAVADIATRRIPNWITVPGAALGLAIQSYYGGWHGTLSSLAGAGLGFGFFLLLHIAGGLGAGDVKLAGAVGALVGAQSFVPVFIATGLLGGLAALALALWRGRLRQTLAQTGRLMANFGSLRWEEVRRKSELPAPGALRLPYGAVIAAGTVTFLAFFH
jgi:prepilin peptidase CpaA